MIGVSAMQKVTLEITIPISSEEERAQLLVRYFNGDFQKIILDSLKDITSADNSTTDNKDVSSKLDSIIAMLSGSGTNTSLKENVSTNASIVQKTEELKSQQQLKELLEQPGLPERKKPTTGLFSRKSIRRV